MGLIEKTVKRLRPKDAVVDVKKLLADRLTVRRPTSWPELSEAEAWQVFRMMTADGLPMEDVPAMAFMTFNRFTVCGRSTRGDFIVAGHDTLFELSPEACAEIVRPMAFMQKPPEMPWRPERFRRYRAVPADLQGLCFAEWLCIENYLQRVIFSGDFSLLDNLNGMLMVRPPRMARLLNGIPKAFTPAERLAVFFWMQSVKGYLQKRFPHFYTAVDGESQSSGAVTPQMLQESMDTQIRALTKGDITKENAVLEMDMYRALSELNALAKEYKEQTANLKNS